MAVKVETRPVTPGREVTTPIRPSEAIRLGMLTKPRGIVGTFFDGEDGACALGAMLVGFGGGEESWRFSYAAAVLPAYLQPPCGCDPEGHTRDIRGFTASEAIYHLNDWHNWDRGVIAEWLRQEGL